MGLPVSQKYTVRDFSLTSNFGLFPIVLKFEIVVRQAHHCFYLKGSNMESLYTALMIQLFWWCVDVLAYSAEFLGISYEELNIYVFIILHPAITAIFIYLWWRERNHRLSATTRYD